ncbi:MAG: hypothetical protein EP343_02815 [Deltaproteobacteria bacterium]|nr:MAG: hypothetical protein EP343_02815 [Deltaproteobacteria bacterium]
MNSIAKWFPYALLLLFTALTAWGLLGMVEYFVPTVKLGLQNAKFPTGLQFLHFASILAAGTVFLVGYVVRWRHTPFAMVLLFAVMATLCFVETVDFMAFGGGNTRFLVMSLEYVMYLGLSFYFLRSSAMNQRFSLDT